MQVQQIAFTKIVILTPPRKCSRGKLLHWPERLAKIAKELKGAN
jgi:hypothetical protein